MTVKQEMGYYEKAYFKYLKYIRAGIFTPDNAHVVADRVAKEFVEEMKKIEERP